MFAYIKLLNGKHKDKKKIINTSQLRSFRKETYSKNIKYQLKSDDNEACIVLMIAGMCCIIL